MSQRSKRPDAIEEFNSRVDRAVHWVVENRVAMGVVAAALLVGAGGYGVYDSVTTRQELAASAALAQVETAYREAMGATPDAARVTEPANPELAERVRREFEEEFREVALEHPGTSSAVVAQLNAGNRRVELGEPEAALPAFEAARDAAPSGSALRGLALTRLGRAYEQLGRYEEAALVFEAAGEIEEFPLRYQVLADAARSHANAGDEPAAVALYQRIELEAPDLVLPEHVRSRLRELEIGSLSPDQ
ncbi:MAG: tetratricopeptide repeat protein [Myxococcota bacterium]